MPWLSDGSHSFAGASVSRASRVEYSLRNPHFTPEMVLINVTLIHAKWFPQYGSGDQSRVAVLCASESQAARAQREWLCYTSFRL